MVHTAHQVQRLGDLPSNDAFALSLLTNADVIAVDQHSSNNHQSYAKGAIIAWLADVPGGGDHYVAVFNIGDSAEKVGLSWADVGVNGRRAMVRDLWQRQDVGTAEGIHENLHRTPACCIRFRGSELLAVSTPVVHLS
jgi:hypothetical protein